MSLNSDWCFQYYAFGKTKKDRICLNHVIWIAWNVKHNLGVCSKYRPCILDSWSEGGSRSAHNTHVRRFKWNSKTKLLLQYKIGKLWPLKSQSVVSKVADADLWGSQDIKIIFSKSSNHQNQGIWSFCQGRWWKAQGSNEPCWIFLYYTKVCSMVRKNHDTRDSDRRGGGVAITTLFSNMLGVCTQTMCAPNRDGLTLKWLFQCGFLQQSSYIRVSAKSPVERNLIWKREGYFNEENCSKRTTK